MKSSNGDHKDQGTEQSPRRDDAHTQHQQFSTHCCLSTVQVCTVYPKVLSSVLFPPPQNGCSCVLRSGLDKQRPEELKMTTGTPGLPFPSLLVLWLKLKPNSKEIHLKIVTFSWRIMWQAFKSRKDYLIWKTTLANSGALVATRSQPRGEEVCGGTF